MTKYTYLLSLLVGDAKASLQGLSLTAGNYKVACDMLAERFGKKERIIFNHIQELLHINCSNQQVADLYKLQDKLLSHVRSLESLGINGYQYGVILTPMILSKLPTDIRMEWARVGEGKETDLSWLLDFLKKEISCRERSETFKAKPLFQQEARRRPNLPSATSLFVKAKGLQCGVCRKHHKTVDCWKLTNSPVKDRHRIIRSGGLCFRCLGTGHMARTCEASCNQCGGGHHSLICSLEEMSATAQPVTTENNPACEAGRSEDVPTSPSVNLTCNSVPRQGHSQSTVLQMAEASVKCGEEVIAVNVLFDTGSDRSYIRTSLVKQIKPLAIDQQHVSYVAFGNEKAGRSLLRNVYCIELENRMGEKQPLTVTEIPAICAPIRRAMLSPSTLDKISKMMEPMAFQYDTCQKVDVEILIGMDHYWRFVSKGTVQEVDGLAAQETFFGVMLSGSVSGTGYDEVTHQLLCLNDISEELVRKFWDLDTVGVHEDGSDPPVNDQVLKEFEENIKYDLQERRYIVQLPWKKQKIHLIDNFNMAKQRLRNLDSRLERDSKVKRAYEEALTEMEHQGVIHEVPPEECNIGGTVYYMPHRPVIKEDRRSTKIRPVFDASAASYNGVSLNDCLETGPSLISNLPEILIRFRRWKFALSADIKKAFHQIKVCKEEQDVHRFLWFKDGRLRTMRFDRVPFGNKASPFLLNATLRHHLKTMPPSQSLDELLHNLYVDDWLSGGDTEEEVSSLIISANDVLKGAGMPLSKWSSNSQKIANLLKKEFGEKTEVVSTKVLGLHWLPMDDCFVFDGVDVVSGVLVTKRLILSLIARSFDPLGFLAPYIMLAKCIFQELWKKGLSWDEEVPEAERKAFQRWMEGMATIRQWVVPRSFTGRPWMDNSAISLQAFGDASEMGYGACVYIVVDFRDGSKQSSLVFAKSRLAPLKRVTLPRLELMAALLCAKLLRFVQKSLHLPVTTPYTCWTDAAVTLAWIKSDPWKWKTFISNRVMKIQEMTNPSNWAHCPGRENPADLVTRGVHAEELVNSTLWLRGPKFLRTNQLTEDSEFAECLNNSCEAQEEEVVVKTHHSLLSQVNEPPVVPLSRYNSITRLIRVMSWANRFVYNCRNNSRPRTGSLSGEELEDSKDMIIKYVQNLSYINEIRCLKLGSAIPRTSPIIKLSPFFDESGLLRVGGRLDLADLPYEEKHPVILPKGLLSPLIVKFYHLLLKHGGVHSMLVNVRKKYWIVGARRLAKGVKRECFACKRIDAQAFKPPMAPLPKDRIEQARPFEIVGLDYAGLLYCSDFPSQKYYILLFTCAVVRAVHLELVGSLAREEFTIAFRRFVARRGTPTTIYSDNAKTFVSAEQHFLKFYGAACPKWKYITPRAPWHGGWWKRLVRSVKTALKKSVGCRSLTRVELETNLHEIEACLNSRPLTFVGDDPELPTPLTPACFLIGRTSMFSALSDFDLPLTNRRTLIANLSHQTMLLDQFWAHWNEDYIKNLPPWKGLGKAKELTVGTLVLIREDNCPRLRWPLGLVNKIFPGKDGITRTVQLKTVKGLLLRPVQRLHLLEMGVEAPGIENSVEGNDSEITSQGVPDSGTADQVRISRFGRRICAPKSYD